MIAEQFSNPGLMTSLVLPWLIGCIWVKILLEGSGRWNYFIVVGHGYFVGIFIMAIILRLGFAIGIDISFWPAIGALLAIGIAGILLQIIRGSARKEPTSTFPLPMWQKLIIIILLGLLAWRYATLLQELLTRPLYSWDSWMNWAPKAITWFHLNEFTNFVSPDMWLQQSVDGKNHTLGNYHASVYPPLVPLIMLWSMMGAGTWDNTHIYLPWILLAVALGLALYGHLRLAGASSLLATTAVYILLSIPYLNVHIALAGYADLWLAAAFGMAMFSAHEWDKCRSWSYATLCLTLAIFCSQLKTPGIVLGVIILLTLLRSLLNLSFKKELTVLFIMMAVSLCVFIFGVSFQIPFAGYFSVSLTNIEIPLLGSFALKFKPIVSSAFITALFFMLNWNILWFLLIFLLTKCFFSGNLIKQPSSVWLGTFLALFFVVFVFYFTYHYEAALNFATINRALIYPIPALVFLLFQEINLLTSNSKTHNQSD